ncbi:MAG: zinc-ribbon domain-containing protein, partial [Corynebacterium variabile]
MAAGWHPIKNAPLTAEDVFAGSEVDRWWMCPEGHIEHKSPKKRCHLSVQQTRARTPDGGHGDLIQDTSR